MNEGATNTVTLDYTNYPPTTIYWAIQTNYTAGDTDWAGGTAPSGTVFVQGTGTSQFSFTAAADMITEGTENYVLRVGTFPGSTNILNTYLAIADTSVAPQADFTVEWWQKVENNGQNSRPWSVGFYPTVNMAVSYEGHINDYVWINSSSIGMIQRTHANQGWQHMTLVRHNGLVKLYENGQRRLTMTDGNVPITDITRLLYVGTGELAAGMFRGYLTDLHIIKGVAKYTDNFSPPTQPITSTTGSVFLLPATTDGTKFVDTVGSKTAVVTNVVTWSADEPYSWPTQTFTAFAYGGVNIALNSPYLSVAPQLGLKVSDSSGWSDYVYSTDIPNHLTFYTSVPNRAPGEVYTIGEETNPLTININYAGSGGGGSSIEGRLSQYPATIALLAVRAGWTYLDPNGGTGTVTSNAYLQNGSVFLNVSAILGTWTFTPPVRGGSLYFDGVGYLHYGASADWAPDA